MEQRITALFKNGHITLQEAATLMAAVTEFTVTLAVGDSDSAALRKEYGELVCDHLVKQC